MHLNADTNRPFTPQERWMYGIFLFVIMALFVAEVFTSYEPRKLTALVFFISWFPLIALHEAGHAITAYVLGWRVGQIVIGMGRPVSRFRLGNTLIELRILPLEGFVTCVPRNLVLPQLKHAAIYAAGPGIELLLVAVLLLFIGPDRLFSASDSYGIIVAQGIGVAAVTGAVLNLIPHSAETSGGRVPNDGLGILLSLTRTEADYADQVGRTFNARENDWEEYDPADWWKRK